MIQELLSHTQTSQVIRNSSKIKDPKKLCNLSALIKDSERSRLLGNGAPCQPTRYQFCVRATIDFFLATQWRFANCFRRSPETTSASFGPQVTNPQVILCCFEPPIFPVS